MYNYNYHCITSVCNEEKKFYLLLGKTGLKCMSKFVKAEAKTSVAFMGQVLPPTKYT